MRERTEECAIGLERDHDLDAAGKPTNRSHRSSEVEAPGLPCVEASYRRRQWELVLHTPQSQYRYVMAQPGANCGPE